MNNTNSILTVSALTKQIKENLENSFPNFWVEGEVSNSKYAASGHLYFTLKDEFSQISCVMWRGLVQSNIFKIEDGLKIIVNGAVTVYEPRGSYQIVAATIKPVGIGELQLAFEQLKLKLKNEGLFDLERKRNLLKYPNKIGIITSPQGAVLHDLLVNIKRRYPLVEIFFAPVKVQGKGSVEEVATALNYFSKNKIADFVILARGGGSIEDLWTFNSEEVAREISNCSIPVVSAIGHETDFTIADFVADLRAPTPSSAAELVVPDKEELIENFSNSLYFMQSEVENFVNEKRNWINSITEKYWIRFPQEIINQYKQKIDYINSDLETAKKSIFENLKNEIEKSKSILEMLNPKAVLNRGYSITSKNKKVILSETQVSEEDEIETILANGKIKSIVKINEK